MDEIFVILIILLFVCIFLYYFYHYYDKNITSVSRINQKCIYKQHQPIIKIEEEKDNDIDKTDINNDKKIINIKDYKIKSEHPGYINDLIKKPEIYNENNEYIKQFEESKVNHTNNNQFISDNYISYKPREKSDVSTLPMANINVNLL